MKTRKATISKTKHKSNPYVVTLEGRTDKKVTLRYTTPWRAAIGAVRAERDWLEADHFNRGIRITYHDGRVRNGYIHTGGFIFLGALTTPKPAKKK